MYIHDLLDLLGANIRHFFMKWLGIFDALHDPEDDFGYICCA